MSGVKTALKGLGVLVGVPATYLLAVGLLPGLRAPAQLLPASGRRIEEGEPLPGSKRGVSFPVRGTPVAASLYLPEGQAAPVPCIIMAHGLGGIVAMGLERYAVRFLQAGFAVLAFDYRYWGESGGEPRHLAWIPSQQEDWAAAVEYVRGLAEVDPARIALWGTSLSGGHVLVTAARDGEIACVSAQVPALDMLGATLSFLRGGGFAQHLGRHGIAPQLLTIMHAQRDLVRSWLGLSPHRIPLVGRPGTVAAMDDADAWDLMARLAPEGFANEVCARIVLRVDRYRPIRQASGVSCPVLLQTCDRDPTTPESVVQDAMGRLGSRAELRRYPISHFDIYIGDGFERAVGDQVEFFRRHLRGAVRRG